MSKLHQTVTIIYVTNLLILTQTTVFFCDLTEEFCGLVLTKVEPFHVNNEKGHHDNKDTHDDESHLKMAIVTISKTNKIHSNKLL